MTNTLASSLLTALVGCYAAIRLLDYRLYSDAQRSHAPRLLALSVGVWVLVGALSIALLAGIINVGWPFDPVWFALAVVFFDLLIQQWAGIDTPPSVALVVNRLRDT